MEKKVLITGASGLLGRAIYKYLTNDTYQKTYPVKEGENCKWHCLGLCFNRAKADLKPLDLNDFSKVDQLIDEFKVLN
jgi:S-adenosylmethionine synthetase